MINNYQCIFSTPTLFNISVLQVFFYPFFFFTNTTLALRLPYINKTSNFLQICLKSYHEKTYEMKELSMLIILYRAINNQMVLKLKTVVTDAKMFSCSQQSTHRGVFFFGHSFFVFLSSKCSILFACFLHSAPPSISSFCFYTGDNQLLGPAHMIKRSLTSRINGRVHYCNVSTVYMDEFIIVRCSGFCIHERSY